VNRDLKQLAEEIERATLELAEERTRHVEAEAAAAEVESLRQLLHEKRAERDRVVAAELDRLTSDVHVLSRAVGLVEPIAKDAGQAWERLLHRIEQSLPGTGLEKFEAMMAMVGRPGAVITDIDHGRHDARSVTAIQAARRQRRHVPRPREPGSGNRVLAPLLRQPWRGALEELGPKMASELSDGDRVSLAEADAAAERIASSQPSDCDLDAVHVWHPLPWLGFDPTDHPVAAALGYIADGTADPSVPARVSAPLSAAMSATQRASLVAEGVSAFSGRIADQLRRNAAITGATARLRFGWSRRPYFPQPGDAVDIRHLYALSALGSWSRADQSRAVNTASMANAAVVLNLAALFWLPTGQTHSFVAGAAIAEEDLAAIRLPFPQVLLAFSDPIVITPTVSDPDPALDARDAAILDLLQQRSREPRVSDFVLPPGDPGATLWQAIASRGAVVEGVLLQGDSLGNLDDMFVWCLAVPSLNGCMLGRFAVPARRSATRWSAEVTNLAAVAAWADWHEPDSELRLPAEHDKGRWSDLNRSSDFRRLAQRGGAGSVRVLNVKRTISPDSASAGSGRTVAPHARRGHWRRQHHGPGGSLIKRIRVPPVLVNAGRAEMTPRVYRLPVDQDATV
jgi:hypothetical protein